MQILHMHVKHQNAHGDILGDAGEWYPLVMKRRLSNNRGPTKQFFRQWREYLELTQERALDRLEWSQSKLSRIESGATTWNAYDLADLEHAYGVSTWLLLNVDPQREGKVVDLMRLIEKTDHDQAIRVLQALNGTEH